MDNDLKEHTVYARQAGKTGARGPRPGPANDSNDFKEHMVCAKKAGQIGARGPRPSPASRSGTEGYSRISLGQYKRKSPRSLH